jgi:hypothetical protein
VVFGRVAGRSVSTYLLNEYIDYSRSGSASQPLNVNLQQKSNGLTIDIVYDQASAGQATSAQGSHVPPVVPRSQRPKVYSQEPTQHRSTLPTPPKSGTIPPVLFCDSFLSITD